MLLQIKTINIEDDFLDNAKTIEITSSDIYDLNKNIKEDIKRNEIEREKGLEVAARCRMR